MMKCTILAIAITLTAADTQQGFGYNAGIAIGW